MVNASPVWFVGRSHPAIAKTTRLRRAARTLTEHQLGRRGSDLGTATGAAG
jgi:hypothetical protein